MKNYIKLMMINQWKIFFQLPLTKEKYVDNNAYKDNRINTTSPVNDPFNSRNSFKRSYKLKKKQPFEDVVDDSALSMSTSVSPFDEKYGELRDEIFNQSLKDTPVKSKSQLNLS